MPSEPIDAPAKDRQERILDAVLSLLSKHGISGVSIRAVAREAGVALGLVNYYYEDKTGLVGAALRRIEEQDIALVTPDPSMPPEDRLRAALRRVADPEFLTTEYLSLRLQLWALAQAHQDFADINTVAQKRYRAGLARLIHTARPELSRRDCNQRAADVDVVQNGMWLTALLGLDPASPRRAVARLAAELEGVFARTWQWVCHVERLAKPGSYVATTVAGMPIAMVRDRAGVLERSTTSASIAPTNSSRAPGSPATSSVRTTHGPTT